MTTPLQTISKPKNDSPPLLLALPTLTSYLQISRSQIYQLMQGGKFPRPLKLGRSSRWLNQDIQDWIEYQASIRSPMQPE